MKVNMKQQSKTIYLRSEHEPESVIPRRLKKIAQLQKAYDTSGAGVFRRLLDNAVVPDKRDL